jgi:hypothetical protein
VAATLVTAAAVAVLAVPSFGLIPQTSSTVSATSAASSPEELAAAIAAEESTTAAASVENIGALDGAPFPVATTTVTLVDPTRSTPARGSTAASSSRTLTVTISYPVTESSTKFPLVAFIYGYDAELEGDISAFADIDAVANSPGLALIAAA